MKLVYKCPLQSCGKVYTSTIPLSCAPWCFGRDDTHSKEMVFQPELSEGTPDYEKKGKK